MRPYTNLYVSERYTANRQNNPDSPTAKGANNSLLEGEKRPFCSLVDGFPLADMPHFTTAKAMFLKEQAENAGHYFP